MAYINYSYSVNYANAIAEGKKTKSQIKKIVGRLPKELEFEQIFGEPSEWHHTSKFYNCTDMWEVPKEFLNFVKENKKYLRHLCDKTNCSSIYEWWEGADEDEINSTLQGLIENDKYDEHLKAKLQAEYFIDNIKEAVKVWATGSWVANGFDKLQETIAMWPLLEKAKPFYQMWLERGVELYVERYSVKYNWIVFWNSKTKNEYEVSFDEEQGYRTIEDGNFIYHEINPRCYWVKINITNKENEND